MTWEVAPGHEPNIDLVEEAPHRDGYPDWALQEELIIPTLITGVPTRATQCRCT
jgi:hypothetical protein